MNLWFHCNWGWRTLACVRFVFILLMFFTWTHLRKLQQMLLWGIAHFTAQGMQLPCCHCRSLLLLCEQNCSVVLPPSRHWQMSQWNRRGFFCHFTWACPHNPSRLWGLMEAFFSSTQYHHDWHGNLSAGSPAPNCASPPAGTGGLLLWGLNLHEKYLIKSNLCENLLGRVKEGWNNFPASLPCGSLQYDPRPTENSEKHCSKCSCLLLSLNSHKSQAANSPGQLSVQ